MPLVAFRYRQGTDDGRHFIHCTSFGLVGFGDKIRREDGRVFALNTGHDTMITQPQELANILLQQIE